MKEELTDIDTGESAKAYSHDNSAFQAYFSMLWGAFAFASMGVLGHLAGERCDWQIVAIARAFFGFIFSVAIAVFSGARLVFAGPAILWVRSLLGGFGVICLLYALTHLPISTALTLSNTYPLWITFLAWPLLGYRPTTSIWVAAAAGVAGVVLIQKPILAAGNLAGLAALANAFSTALSMIGLNKLGGVDARAVVAHHSGVSTLVCLAFIMLSGSAVSVPQLEAGNTLLLLIGVGLAGTIGQLGMTRAFALGHPAKVAVVGLTQVIFGFCWDVMLWNHSFDQMTIYGLILVVTPTGWLLLHNPLRRKV